MNVFTINLRIIINDKENLKLFRNNLSLKVVLSSQGFLRGSILQCCRNKEIRVLRKNLEGLQIILRGCKKRDNLRKIRNKQWISKFELFIGEVLGKLR